MQCRANLASLDSSRMISNRMTSGIPVPSSDTLFEVSGRCGLSCKHRSRHLPPISPSGFPSKTSRMMLPFAFNPEPMISNILPSIPQYTSSSTFSLGCFNEAASLSQHISSNLLISIRNADTAYLLLCRISEQYRTMKLVISSEATPTISSRRISSYCCRAIRYASGESHYY